MFSTLQNILVRTPLLPLNSAYNFDINSNDKLFEEGVFLSSPDLWMQWKKFNDLNAKQKNRLIDTLNKYWIRSSTRATPFATFAGCALVQIGDETKLHIKSHNNHKKYLRFDSAKLIQVIKTLSEKSEIKYKLKIHTNNSIYDASLHYRYAKFNTSSSTYELVSVKKTAYISFLLDSARKGATIGELASLIEMEFQVTLEESIAFVNELIDQQLLVSELYPSLTGAEPFETLLETLSKMDCQESTVTELLEIKKLLHLPSPNIDSYQKISEKICKLEANSNTSSTSLQIDLYTSSQTKLTLKKEIVEKITAQISELMIFSTKYEHEALLAFIKQFQSKFENEEIPLIIALDPDLGLGYPVEKAESNGECDIIGDLVLSSNREMRFGNSFIQQFSLLKYEEYSTNDKEYIEIVDADINEIKKRGEKYTYSNSMFIKGNLISLSGAIDESDFSFNFHGFGGPSAAKLFGRFTHGDKDILRFTQEIIHNEEQQDANVIYAEIVHWPDAKLGNILIRPTLRKYEIPYVGKSGVDESCQITLDDLMISIYQNEVIIRSKALNKRIIPRLTSAHNYTHRSLPLYRFLCDLQSQNKDFPVIWDWGQLSIYKHLPRVIYKNIILSRAKWRIVKDDMKEINEDNVEFTQSINEFISKKSLPQQIVHVDGDNELLIMLNDIKGINLLKTLVKKNGVIDVEEFIFNIDNCITKDTNGNVYTNEIVIPLSLSSPTPNSLKENSTAEYNNKPFPPFSKWLYYKLYIGNKASEDFLCECLYPFIEKNFQIRGFEKFFFIRYKDEFPHLRIRFMNKSNDKQLCLHEAFMNHIETLIVSGIINKITVDTYKREVERYGAHLIDEAESIFHNDSIATLSLSRMLMEEQNNTLRIMCALRGIDMLLNDFGTDLDGKVTLLADMQNQYFQKYGSGIPLQRQLNEKYRAYQKKIFSFLNPGHDFKNNFQDFVFILKQRSKKNTDICKTILQQSPDTSKLHYQIKSYIHMSMNRLFVAGQNKYELLVYHFLHKYYSSLKVMQK